MSAVARLFSGAVPVRAVKALVMMSAMLLSCATSQAGLVIADFNDLATDTLRSQGGGTGFSGDWTNGKPGEPSPEVVSDDLTSAKYSFQQSGTAQRLGLDPGIPAYGVRRDLAADFSSEFWFSFLARPASSTPRMEVAFNQSATDDLPTANDMSVILVTGTEGEDVWVRQGSTVMDEFGGDLAEDTTYLVLGRVTPQSGSDQVDLWFDPDVTAYSSEADFLAGASPDSSNSSTDFFAGNVTNVFVTIYQNADSQYAYMDALVFSDTETAFADVTGVPEPTTMVLLGLGALGLIRRKRKV
jgi:hypothetical protein